MLTTLQTSYTDTRAGDLAWCLGKEPLPALAETESKFFFRESRIEAEFVRDEDGRVTHLLMHRDGRVRRAPRIGD